LRFCVIGAGSGGRAFAAYLSSRGYSVNLYNRSFSRISDIKRKGGIQSIGALKGFYPIDITTQNLELAVKNAHVILIVTPAFAHKEIAKNLAPYLRDGQIIILNPGRTFGAVEFSKIIEKERGVIPIFVGETQTLLFTSRELPGNKVNIIRIKDSVNLSTFPDKYTYLIHDILKDVFPQFVPVDDYLEVTLNNIGMLLHPAISLLNAGAMDFGRKFKFYKEGATSRVCQILEQIEFEINEIFDKLGLKHLNFSKWAKKSYGIRTNSIFDAIQKIKAYKDIYAPTQLITRYFTEDVPTGLVALSSLGTFLDVKTPTIDSIIHLTSILCGMDFFKTGRTIEQLGIENLIEEKLHANELLSEEILLEKDKMSKSEES